MHFPVGAVAGAAWFLAGSATGAKPDTSPDAHSRQFLLHAGLDVQEGPRLHHQHQQHHQSSKQRPNIVFILTDDQDLLLNSLDYQPLLKKHLLDRGTSYKKHFCTTAVCCPSRVSLLTGKLAHNTNVTDVNPPYGGYPKFISQGYNEKYLPVWLQDAGYNTYYTGKIFNAFNVDNYNDPYPAGWNESDFLVDPYTYDYLNSSFVHNRGRPVSYEGEHSVDVLTQKAYKLLENAASQDNPFFLGIAPAAPHSNVHLEPLPGGDNGELVSAVFSPPIPAKRHEGLFPDVRVPRTPNFNPESPSGANWIRRRPRISQEDVDSNDHFYRQRLRALQSVDELVDGVFARLESLGLLDDTYIFYTADNGYHIGQHRLPPGKECGYDEDVNVPLIVRGPGVPQNRSVDFVTTHTDLAPTFLDLAGVSSLPPEKQQPEGFDGEPVPLTADGIAKAAQTGRQEHVTIEYWGFAAFENGGRLTPDLVVFNNTYKAVRIVAAAYNLYYSVWCNHEHELYDLSTDPYQINNLLGGDGDGDKNKTSKANPPTNRRLLGLPLTKVVDRLDSLLLVLKSCAGRTCIRPWEALHPQGNVQSLSDALSTRFDTFYAQQAQVRYDHCELGYLIEAEGPQFETHGLKYEPSRYSRHGLPWHEWV